ncbi:MAG: hypothetical protein V4723_14335 [Pseudomonadota bacterium]
MSKRPKLYLKLYAQQRMAAAIDRAITAGAVEAKERAARWAAAWGLLAGVKSKKVRLKRLDPRDIGDWENVAKTSEHGSDRSGNSDNAFQRPTAPTRTDYAPS